MAKKNTVLIIAGVAAAAGIVYLMTRPKAPVATPPIYHNPTPTGSNPSLLMQGAGILTSLLGNGGATWLANLFKNENSPTGSYTAGGSTELPKIPGYLDYTGGNDSTILA